MIEFDEKIINMIRDLFKNWIETIDAICFVANSTIPRLTTTQKYIFSSIVSLFGNDIADNFVSMLTFVMEINLKFLHLFWMINKHLKNQYILI